MYQSVLEKNKIVDKFNYLFSRDERYRKARNLTVYDGGTMPKSLQPDDLLFLENYTVMNKPNGEGVFIYFTFSGIFVIKKNNVMLLKIINLTSESIIIGEIMKDNRVYAFDTLYYNNVDVRKDNYIKRYKYLSELKRKMDVFEILPLFFSDNLHDDIYDAFKYISEKWGENENDGIILKNVHLPFNSNCVYKWKPPENITIDLSVFKFDDYGNYKGYGLENGKLTEFKGNEKYPYNGIIFCPENINIPSDGVIAEVIYNKEFKRLEIERIRYDKVNPNSIFVAKRTWGDINDPITAKKLIEASKNMLSKAQSNYKNINIICKHIKKYDITPQLFERLNKFFGNDIISQAFIDVSFDLKKKGKKYNISEKIVECLNAS